MNPNPDTSIQLGWKIWLASVTAIGMLLFGYHHLAVVASGGHQSWRAPLITEMSAAFIAGLLFLGVRALVRRLPPDSKPRSHWLPIYFAAFLIFAVVFTSLYWFIRWLLFPLAGLGPFDYGKMPLRYAMEAPMQAIAFVAMVAILHGTQRLHQARERALEEARLERSLADARLHNLQLQLQPHFLFNALHTISSTMYQDVEAADRMIEHLGDLLRRSLEGRSARRVPLSEELEILNAYLDIMRARFGERLQVEIEVAPEAEASPVPILLLQPLVENAIRHGGVEKDGRGRIRVQVERELNDLVVSVVDDGSNSQPTSASTSQGIGLATTEERLQLLYGEDQSFWAGPSPNGGFRVDIRLPAEHEAAARGTAP